MEVLRVVFPHYWMTVNYDKSFKKHINVIKVQYYYPKKIGPNQTLVPKVLFFCFGSLDLHMSFFKLTMKNNVASTMGPPYIVNPMTQLWISLASSQVIAHNLPKYLKLLKISMVWVIGSIKEERCFNNLNFIKSKFHNQLTMHLDLLVWMFVQQIYMLENFPYP